MKQNINSGNLNRIKEELERRLIVLRYSEATTKNHMRIFGWVEEYLKGYGEQSYSKESGQRFIAEYMLQAHHAPTQFTNAKTVVRRMDEIVENKLFAPCFRKPEPECAPRFFVWREKYLEHLVKRGFKETTAANHKRGTVKLLNCLPDTVVSLEKLTSVDLYNAFTQYKWTNGDYIASRGFLVFLFESGATMVDLSVCVPRPRRPQPLPSVYSGDEVSRLLSVVDRTTHMGKRDYAVILLAAYMGLRSSDTANLSFSDIDSKSKTIEIVQVKTGNPVKLVMNANVEEALLEYIHDGRPKSSSDKIFLNSQAPYAPLAAASGYDIVRRNFIRAGIAAQGRRRGTHALRSSFATALVGKGVPYAVVQEALGHEDPESAKHYVRIDVRRLRMCALDVPKPTGAFAALLGDLEGVL